MDTVSIPCLVLWRRARADIVRIPTATKFYTEDGNYDLVGLNFPVFFVVRSCCSYSFL